MGKLVSYLRLSKEDEFVKDESNSISNQRELIRKYIRKSPELMKMEQIELKDDGYSGKNMERPAMQELLSMIKKGKVSCIIVKDISRFSRDYIETGKYMEQIFPFLGIRFISINDNYDSAECTGGIAELDVAFKGIIYDFYSEDLSEKVKTSLSVRRASGKYLAPFAPYGYRKSENDKHKLEVDEEAAHIVKRIYNEYICGSSMYQIAQKLNEEHVITPAEYISRKGYHDTFNYVGKIRTWTSATVSRILRNEMYTGNYVYGRFKSAEVGAKHPVAQSEENWKKIENHHEAIISDEMFDTVQKKRAGNRNTSQVRKSHCLKGKIICGNCGHKMTHSNVGRPKYECRQHYVNHSITGCVKSVRDEDIEVIVIQELQAKLDAMLDNEKVQKRQKQLQSEKMHEAEKKLRTMLLSQDKIEADLQNAYESYKAGITDKETYLEQRQVYEQIEDKIQETVQKQMIIVSEYEEKVLTMPAGFDIIESRTKVVELNREIVETFVDRIVVHEGGEIEIGWKFGGVYK